MDLDKTDKAAVSTHEKDEVECEKRELRTACYTRCRHCDKLLLATLQKKQDIVVNAELMSQLA